MERNPLLPGQLEAGNIDLRTHMRPSVPNPEGGNSTVFSESANQGGVEVLYPRVVSGQILSSDDAWQHYLKTGEHLGKFSDVPTAEKMGQMIHTQQETDPMIRMLLNSFKF